MILAAHQPAFLPWLGYLDKLARCDVFVLLDDVQFEQRGFQNRNRVKTSTGAAWLTVPLVHGSQLDRICDKQIVDTPPSEGWRRKAWLTLLGHYRRAAHFDRYADELQETFRRPWSKLVDLDGHLLALLMRWFGIHRTVVSSSSLEIATRKSERILDLCRRVGADVYLSGDGGSRDYLDVELLRRGGVEVRWQAFTHPVYPQCYPSLGFIPMLSAIDMLLNCGPESAARLFGAAPEVRASPG